MHQHDSLRSLIHSLGQVISSLVHLHLESLIRLEILLDLADGQIDEHTGDLRSEFGANHLDDEVIDAFTNLTLKMGISLIDCWEELLSSHQIVLDGSSATTLRHVHAGLSRHVLRRSHWHVRLRHGSLRHSSSLHVRLRHTHVTTHRLLGHSLSSHHVLLHALEVVVAHRSSGMRSTLSLASMMSVSTLHSLLLIVLSVLLFMSMDDLHKSGQDMGEVRQVGELVPLESTGLLSLISFPISLILGFFILDLSDLLDFIVADVESLAINIVVVQVLFSLSSIIGLLEANEGESVS